MHFEVPQTVGKEEAIRRINQTIDELEKQTPPAGITVKDFSKTWTDNVLRVSAWAGKSIFGGTVAVTVTVEETRVLIDLELPTMLKAFIPEAKIEEEMRNKVTPLLN